MKILHIGLASHFTDKMLYQDNILAGLNAEAGHDVTFISDNYAYDNGVLVETEVSDEYLDNGVRLIRIKYDKVINRFVSNKIQKAKAVVRYMNEINPDTILFHGVCGYELMDVANYVKEKKIPFYIDSHENFKNTAMTPASKLAYKYIHGIFVRKAIPIAKKILFVGYPEKEYLQKMYHISEEKLEYFPLGGIILDKEKQGLYRSKVIKDLGFPDDAIICSHSGKMDKGKKTEDVIRGFSRVNDDRLRLLIYGTIPEDMKPILEPLIKADERIAFLGWKTAAEQEELLGATDIYIQPGTYSATAQIALCDGCALILNSDYKKTMHDAPFYEDTFEGIEETLRSITRDEEILQVAKQACFLLALTEFDYKKLADRYLR